MQGPILPGPEAGTFRWGRPGRLAKLLFGPFRCLVGGIQQEYTIALGCVSDAARPSAD